MSTQRNQIRIGQTRDDFCRLHKQIKEWLELRRELDARLQYSTQLDNLETFFNRLFAALCTQVDGIEPGAEPRAVYQECRIVDQKLVWLREVWCYYADKFDQRDDEGRLGKVIKAADEVVWSCYAGFYKNVSGAERKAAPLPYPERKAAPLPYIEPLYTPQAIPRDEPRVLRNRFIDSAFFQEFLDELPIPVIGLPRSCLEAPWWLIYIGHEVGHHVQHDLLPDLGLVGKFGTCLKDTAHSSSGSASLAEHWQEWGQEVFADAFSVYSLGVWAVWAMTELILGDDRFMLTELEKYPAPAVRLALMAELVTTLDQDGEAGLRGFDPADLADGDIVEDEEGTDLRQAASANLALVPELVKAIDEYQFEGFGPFRKLSGWRAFDFAPNGTIKDWTDRLRGRTALSLKKHLDYPRFVASAGLAAWAEVAALPAGHRADAEAKLAPRFLGAVVDSGPEGKRAAAKPPDAKSLEKTGDKFAQQFLEVSLEDLGL